MRFVMASLKVDFLRPTPIGVELLIKGQLRGIEGRKVQVSLSLSAGGQTCARGEMLAVQFRDDASADGARPASQMPASSAWDAFASDWRRIDELRNPAWTAYV